VLQCFVSSTILFLFHLLQGETTETTETSETSETSETTETTETTETDVTLYNVKVVALCTPAYGRWP
jgi:hypothetical protein